MSEEQIKPKKKWDKDWSNIPTIAFMVIFLCGLTAALFTIGGRWQESPTKPTAYMTTSAQMQNAIIDYQAKNNGSTPTLTGTYTNANCINCRVINISALLIANGGLMKCAPTGLNLSASGNDNCGGNASLGCKKGSNYIWLVNSAGDVYSYCAGDKCLTNDSGYQGVWP